jgi:phosphate transport system permease protein
MIFQSSIVNNIVMGSVSADLIPTNQSEYNLLLNRIENVAYGALPRDGQEAGVLAAADSLVALQATGRWILTCIVSCLVIGGLLFARAKISPQMQAREQVEKMTQMLLLGCACIAVFTTLGIVLSVVFESIRFFQMVPITEFIFGVEWSPQVAIRADQVGSSSSFGAVPLFTGTLMVSAIAMLVAVPAGLMSAIYLSEYASSNVRNYTKPALEILAGIPTVVYGFFAALTVAPFVRELGASMGVSISSESALAAGAVMGVMIIPFISSLSDDVITAVPQSMRDGSLAMGATKSETIRNVIIPAALPGIVGGILLAVSRAIGETMIVVMAAGLAAKLTANPLETVTTVTVQIVTLLTGDQEFDSPKTLAAFALGLMLFSVTLVLNIFALRIVKKYREQYE